MGGELERVVQVAVEAGGAGDPSRWAAGGIIWGKRRADPRSLALLKGDRESNPCSLATRL